MFITIKKAPKVQVNNENWYTAFGHTKAGRLILGYGTTHYNALCNALQRL